jgi:hypothetical protein
MPPCADLDRNTLSGQPLTQFGQAKIGLGLDPGAQLLVSGGLMYIEVSHELTQYVREDSARRIIDMPITIHEHMNSFDRMSIRTIVGSISGLELTDDAEDVVDALWASGLRGTILGQESIVAFATEARTAMPVGGRRGYEQNRQRPHAAMLIIALSSKKFHGESLPPMPRRP